MTNVASSANNPSSKRCAKGLFFIASISMIIYLTYFSQRSSNVGIFPSYLRIADIISLPKHANTSNGEGNVNYSVKSAPSGNITYILSDDMPSIKGTKITAKEIRQGFSRCCSLTIAKDKECASVHKNSTLFWRSVKTTGFSQPQDMKRMQKATECCAFNHTQLMAPSPSNKMFPWEQDYLSQGPLLNMLDTAWATKSIVELVGDKKRTLRIGDSLKFLIQVRDGRGAPRGRGGDSVRLWLVNNDLGASVTANMEDKMNGNYTATVILPWAGQVFVKATIAHTRELFRSTLYVQRLFTSSHWFTGSFKNKKASEGTPCSPLPHLPGYGPSEICNLTEFNFNTSWYCGKPVKKALSCRDIVGTIKIYLPSVQPLTKADQELVVLTEGHQVEPDHLTRSKNQMQSEELG